jgi:pimeloyl-ACP methyl ester carboxylesterase
MSSNDRMNQASITFPVAMSFGDRDFFASNRGAEDILNCVKNHNGGRVNLFKVKKATHLQMQEFPQLMAEYMIGHFEGQITDRWEPTKYGDYQWYDQKPPKGLTSIDK